MKRIIFVNRFFWPDHSATSQILSDLAFSLAADAANFDVHVVTSGQLYEDASARLPNGEIHERVAIHRVWTSRFGRQHLFGRALDYLSFYLSALLELLALAGRDAVIVTKTDPPLISVVGVVAAKIKSAILVNWIHDLFPEIAQALGVKGAGLGPVSGLLLRLRNASLNHARMNVAIGELMRDRLLQEGVEEDRVRVIPNWADGEQIRPIAQETNPLRSEWGLDGQFVVGYSGNFGRAHEFDTILGAMEALRDRQDISFLLIGGGANLEGVRQEVLRRKLVNVVMKPYQPRSALSQSLSASDVHLVSLKPELEGLIVPSKFYGIAAAGRPVLFIGAEGGEIARTIAQWHCGYVVNEGDGDALARCILNLASDAERTRRYGENARALLETQYEKSVAVYRWRALVMGLEGTVGVTGSGHSAWR